MNKKLRGFSLVELMVSLLIISVVLSAAIPAITSKTKTETWGWTTDNSSIFTATGLTQKVIVGSNDSTKNKGKINVLSSSSPSCTNPHIAFYDNSGSFKGSVYADGNKIYYCNINNLANALF